MEGVQKLLGLEVGEEKQIGIAKLSCCEFLAKDDPLFNVRAMINGYGQISDGKYIRLFVGKTLMMSDTQQEINTNWEFVDEAHGRVFIAGLGIGVILHNLKEKIKDGTVTEIVIMEKYQDVIDLVKPFYEDLPITYILADVLEYKPPKEEIFDTIYFDIWPNICTDNLKDIRLLHNRWKFRKNKDNPNAWMNSWMKEELQDLRRREKNTFWYS